MLDLAHVINCIL